MTRLGLIAINLFTGVSLLMAQDPQTGGWRRWNDPPPAPRAQDQDPTQPVERADSYGQQQQTRIDRPPAAVPHYGLPSDVTIKPGTYVSVRMEQELSSDHNRQGDLFSASLAQPIVVDGVVVAQRGQPVMGRVAEAMKAGRAAGTSRLALQLTGLTLADGSQANVQSQLVNRNGQTSVGNDVAAVATTTAMGAAIGSVADWGRGAAIGAGAGAAAGLIGVLLTRGHPTVVEPETLLTFRLDAPVNVDLTRVPQAYRYVGPDEYDRPVQTTVVRRPPAPRYYGAYPYPYPYPYYPGYYGYYPYAYGPAFGVGIVVRGGGYYHGGGYHGGYHR